MTSFLSQITSADAIRVAVRIGFMVEGESRAHALFYRDSDKRRVVIPVHPTRNIRSKTLLAIIAEMGLEPELFRELL